jgi:hypothetical protein
VAAAVEEDLLQVALAHQEDPAEAAEENKELQEELEIVLQYLHLKVNLAAVADPTKQKVVVAELSKEDQQDFMEMAVLEPIH